MKITYREAARDDLTRQFRYYLVTLNLPGVAIRFKEDRSGNPGAPIMRHAIHGFGKPAIQWACSVAIDRHQAICGERLFKKVLDNLKE